MRARKARVAITEAIPADSDIARQRRVATPSLSYHGGTVALFCARVFPSSIAQHRGLVSDTTYGATDWMRALPAYLCSTMTCTRSGRRVR